MRDQILKRATYIITLSYFGKTKPNMVLLMIANNKIQVESDKSTSLFMSLFNQSCVMSSR